MGRVRGDYGLKSARRMAMLIWVAAIVAVLSAFGSGRGIRLQEVDGPDERRSRGSPTAEKGQEK